MLTACGSLTIKSDAPTLPANLASSCPDLPALADGKGATLLKWSVGTVKLYQDCQDKHKALVQAWPKAGKTPAK